jgi:serine O-acetyltransferase
MRLRQLILADLQSSFDSPATSRLKLILKAVLTVRGVALIGFRLSHAVGQRSAVLGALVKQATHVITGADIGYKAKIGPGLRILHPTGIVVTDKANIGAGCTIHGSVTVGSSGAGSPVIGDQVQLAPGARVLGNVRIDNGCHVAANAVLVETIPGEWQVLGGVPARFLRSVER